MSDLGQQMNLSATALQDAWRIVQSVPASASLPAKCYEQWRMRAEMHQLLRGTIPILAARDAAWKVALTVANAQIVKDKPNTVKYANIEMDFAVARHLALASYVSVSWSIYDRLANVCGRLAGVVEIAGNPRQNPKPCEDFLGKKDILGFAGHLHIREAYSWPMKVSYKIRNWLVHEGYEDGGTTLFQGGLITDKFILHDAAMAHLEKCCGYENTDGRIASCSIAKERECWGSKVDLLKVLELYHGEIDTMFTALLKWSVDSFVGQIRAFAARDQV